MEAHRKRSRVGPDRLIVGGERLGVPARRVVRVALLLPPEVHARGKRLAEALQVSCQAAVVAAAELRRRIHVRQALPEQA